MVHLASPWPSNGMPTQPPRSRSPANRERAVAVPFLHYVTPDESEFGITTPQPGRVCQPRLSSSTYLTHCSGSTSAGLCIADVRCENVQRPRCVDRLRRRPRGSARGPEGSTAVRRRSCGTAMGTGRRRCTTGTPGCCWSMPAVPDPVRRVPVKLGRRRRDVCSQCGTRRCC